MASPTENEIIETILSNCEEDLYEYRKDDVRATDKEWSLADLFVRQWFVYGGDGSDMINVKDTYDYLVKHKSLLIEYKLISEEGDDNYGQPLWDKYEIDYVRPEFAPAPRMDEDVFGEYLEQKSFVEKIIGGILKMTMKEEYKKELKKALIKTVKDFELSN